MTVTPQDISQPAPVADNSAENNLAKMRKALESEKANNLQMQRKTQELEKKLQDLASAYQNKEEPDDSGDDPYIDNRRFEKKMNKASETITQKAREEAKLIAQEMFEQKKREDWLEKNPDFEEILTHVDKFIAHDKDFAESISHIPDEFTRQKLAYKAIKSMGLHRPAEQKSSVQDQINNNKKAMFYQPTGIASPGYGVPANKVSEEQGKDLYSKMQALKKNLRLG